MTFEWPLVRIACVLSTWNEQDQPYWKQNSKSTNTPLLPRSDDSLYHISIFDGMFGGSVSSLMRNVVIVYEKIIECTIFGEISCVPLTRVIISSTQTYLYLQQNYYEEKTFYTFNLIHRNVGLLLNTNYGFHK